MKKANPTPIQLREAWLNKVATKLAPVFAKLGHKLPSYRVTCGFTSKGARSKRIGECWASECSSDAHHEIFIHPSYSDSTEVAAILAHELTHAAVGLQAKHGPEFAAAAIALGLKGPMRSTTADQKFLDWFAPILKSVGPYPHAQLNVAHGISSNGPKQSTRLIKVECADCGYVARVTRKWIEESGAPLCPCNSTEMEVK